ncbi:hypothetical protein, partial [Klebsiella pneumoniae]|uniref:hypothetical protein n=1 Tax=Klebsiella pneumoniae TaxID=573 RepID=UPI003CF39B1F
MSIPDLAIGFRIGAMPPSSLAALAGRYPVLGDLEAAGLVASAHAVPTLAAFRRSLRDLADASAP